MGQDDERIELLKASLDEAYRERNFGAAERERLAMLKKAEVDQAKVVKHRQTIVPVAIPNAQSAFSAGRTTEEPSWKGISYSPISERSRLNNRNVRTK